ncbi:hypothetical protein HDU96_005925 [Phlyctochytrium bullatum]|nr:hypothetical protein HDU96_005925 [Phlyctochytrium bullatum]
MEDASENELMLAQLASIENAIVKLLEVGGNAIETLAYEGSDVDSAKERFTRLHGEYMSLLNEIQIGLRQTFRKLSRNGILTGDGSSFGSSSDYGLNPIPYQGSVEGEEKDFEILANTVSLMKQWIRAGNKEILNEDLEEKREKQEASLKDASENEMEMQE